MTGFACTDYPELLSKGPDPWGPVTSYRLLPLCPIIAEPWPYAIEITPRMVAEAQAAINRSIWGNIPSLDPGLNYTTWPVLSGKEAADRILPLLRDWLQCPEAALTWDEHDGIGGDD